jgi:hypothetical protein
MFSPFPWVRATWNTRGRTAAAADALFAGGAGVGVVLSFGVLFAVPFVVVATSTPNTSTATNATPAINLTSGPSRIDTNMAGPPSTARSVRPDDLVTVGGRTENAAQVSPCIPTLQFPFFCSRTASPERLSPSWDVSAPLPICRAYVTHSDLVSVE